MKTLSPMKSYYSREWNFSITYPTDWEILWENEAAGSWIIPIAVAGKEGSGGRPCFSVNVRRGKILQGNPHLKITGWREDGKLIEYPSTPQEYIEQQKAELPSCFPGFQFISGEEIRLAHQPAAKLVYRYDGAKGQIQEQSTTLFGVEIAFQFVSEVPVQEAAKFQPAFNSILESFRIGDAASETSSSIELDTQAISESKTPVQLYNRGVTIYRTGYFEQAIAAFDQCWQSGEYKMQAAYAKALCQGQLGLESETPPEFEGKEDEVGATYVASNFACYLISQGYQAALTNSSQVTAKVKGSVYIINIDGYLGTFLNDAWRKEGKERISLLDSNANPHPTETDQWIMSLIKMASSLPMCPLPEGGLPTALKSDNREDSPEKPTIAVESETSDAPALFLDSSAQKIEDSASISSPPEELPASLRKAEDSQKKATLERDSEDSSEALRPTVTTPTAPLSHWQGRKAGIILLLLGTLGLGTWLAYPLMRDEWHWYQTTRQDASITEFERYLQEHPQGKHIAQARQKLDELHWQEAQATDTIEAYQKYQKQNPSGHFLKEAQERIEAIKIAQAKAALLVLQGNAHLQREDYPKALADYEQALSFNPNEIEAYIGRGLVYDSQQDYQNAISNYNQAIQIQPKNPKPYVLRGMALAAQSKYEEAIADYNHALSLDSKFAMAYRERGRTRFSQENYQEAIADFNQAISLNPSYDDAYVSRGLVYMAQENYQKAIGDFNRAIQINPNNITAYLGRGFVRIKLGDSYGGMADLRKAGDVAGKH